MMRDAKENPVEPEERTGQGRGRRQEMASVSGAPSASWAPSEVETPSEAEYEREKGERRVGVRSQEERERGAVPVCVAAERQPQFRVDD